MSKSATTYWEESFGVGEKLVNIIKRKKIFHRTATFCDQNLTAVQIKNAM